MPCRESIRPAVPGKPGQVRRSWGQIRSKSPLNPAYVWLKRGHLRSQSPKINRAAGMCGGVDRSSSIIASPHIDGPPAALLALNGAGWNIPRFRNSPLGRNRSHEVGPASVVNQKTAESAEKTSKPGQAWQTSGHIRPARPRRLRRRIKQIGTTLADTRLSTCDFRAAKALRRLWALLERSLPIQGRRVETAQGLCTAAHRLALRSLDHATLRTWAHAHEACEEASLRCACELRTGGWVKLTPVPLLLVRPHRHRFREDGEVVCRKSGDVEHDTGDERPIAGRLVHAEVELHANGGAHYLEATTSMRR